MITHQLHASSFSLVFYPSIWLSTSRETRVQQLRVHQIQPVARSSHRSPPSAFLSPRVLVPRFLSLLSHEGKKRSRVQHARRSTCVRVRPAPPTRGSSVAVRSVLTLVSICSSLTPYPRGTEMILREWGILQVLEAKTNSHLPEYVASPQHLNSTPSPIGFEGRGLLEASRLVHPESPGAARRQTSVLGKDLPYKKSTLGGGRSGIESLSSV